MLKSLVTVAIHGLALVGAAEIYKEYKLRQTSQPNPDDRQDDNSIKTWMPGTC